MIKYGEFKKRVLHALQDDGGTYSDDLIYDATVGAIDAILPWCGNHLVAEIEGDGETSLFELPTNCYKVEGVLNVRTHQFAEKTVIGPVNKTRTQAVLDWIEWPQGFLNLYPEPPEGEKLQVFYSAYYGHPSSASDVNYVLDFPHAALMGALYWACAHCLVPGGISSARIRQYNIKTDSGIPTDNALEQSATFLRKMFLDEMNRMPKQPGGVS